MKTNWNELIPDLNWVEGVGFCKQMDVNSLAYVDDEGNLKTDIVLREWDYIQDDKYVVGSEEVILNNENWVVHAILENTIRVRKSISSNGGLMKCDKLPYIIDYSLDAPHIYISNGETLWMFVDKSELATPDLAGFKTWLQTNPITIVYQLAEPKVYDLVSPINLPSYEGRTVVDCNLKVPPIMSFTITSYISELVKTNRNRVSKVTNSISQYIETTLNHSDRLKKLEER